MKITGTDLYDFTQCNHRVYLNTHGDESLKVKLDAATQKLFEDGVLHERAVIADFKFEEVGEGSNEEKEKDTLDLMTSGAELIYQGLLTHGEYVAKPDFLQRVETPSKFGEYSYVPVEIKSAKVPRYEHLAQLYFYAYVVELVQSAAPDHGYIVNAEKEWIRVTIGADEKESLNVALSTIEQIHEQKWTSGPTLVSHCKKCPWQKHCLQYMKQNEDVSLVHRLGKRDKGKMHEAGIMTLTDLAGIGQDEIESKIDSINGKKLARYRIQAEAMKKNEEVLLRKPEFPKAELEVHFDLEIESSYDVCYMFGLLIDDGKTAEYKSIVARRPEDEEKAWNEYLDFLDTLPEGTPLYHWAPFEPMWMKKLSDKYGVSESANKILENNLFDLHALTESSVAFPLSAYTLKDVARHLGFDWRDKEIGGALSMLWYLQWLESGEEEKFDQILRYNEDDVRATKYVKDWLVRL